MCLMDGSHDRLDSIEFADIAMPIELCSEYMRRDPARCTLARVLHSVSPQPLTVV